MQNSSFTDSKMFKMATLLVIFVIVVGISIVGKSFLIPFAWSLLIALASIRMLDRVEKRIKISRLLTSLLFVIIVLLGILFLFYFFYGEIRSMIAGMPSFASKLSAVFHNILNTAKEHGIPVPENIDRNSIHEWVAGHSELIKSSLASFGKSFGKLFMVIIYLFFLILFRDNYIYYLKQREKTDAGFKAALKKYNDVMDVINNFIYGYFIMTLVMAVLLFVIFLLVGLKFALFFALLVALLTLLPYIGYPLGALIVFIFASIFNDTLLIPLLAVGGILAANTLKSYIFKPIIVGDKIKLNAFIIFLSVIVGGMIWGVTGMIIFMPLVGIAKVLLEYNEKTKPLAALLTTIPKGALEQITEPEIATSENASEDSKI